MQHGSPSRLTAELLPQDDVTRAEWSRLAELAGNVFATPEWVDVWCEYAAPEARPLLVGCRDADGVLRALLPLHAQRFGPLRVLRFLGHGASDELGPVCEPADRDAAATALRDAMDARVVPGAVLLAERMPFPTPWASLLGGHVIASEPSPVLPVEGRTFEEFLMSRSRGFRNQVRRIERRLAEQHEVEVHLVDQPDELSAAMDVLYELHAGRWGDESDAFAGAADALHRAFAAVALERGWLRLWTLRLDGQPAASWYGFRFGRADSFYQSGRDRDRDDLMVGAILLARTVRATFDDGLEEYRFLRGNESYKRRWTSEDRPVVSVLAHGRAGTRPIVAGAAALAGSPRVRTAARRLLDRG